jgi:hypothetical protein
VQVAATQEGEDWRSAGRVDLAQPFQCFSSKDRFASGVFSFRMTLPKVWNLKFSIIFQRIWGEKWCKKFEIIDVCIFTKFVRLWIFEIWSCDHKIKSKSGSFTNWRLVSTRDPPIPECVKRKSEENPC